MQNLEQLDLVALDATELQQVQGGILGLGVGVGLIVGTLAIEAAFATGAVLRKAVDAARKKEVKLLENVPRPQ